MEKLPPLFLVVAAIAVISCASPAPPPVSEAEPEPPSLSLKASSEFSMQEQKNSGLWISRPESGALVIIGVSGSMTKQETEVETAREDAARKAAMYFSLKGTVESVNRTGAGFLDYTADSQTKLQYDEDYAKYGEKLTFDPQKDILRIDGAVYVRFKYSAPVPESLNYTYAGNENGLPGWVSRPPRIDGYLVGVGHARRQWRIRETFVKSCDMAAAAIITQISTQITTKETSTGGKGSASTIFQKSEGSLSNFLVIETYFDPKTEGVYTLAIAKGSN